MRRIRLVSSNEIHRINRLVSPERSFCGRPCLTMRSDCVNFVLKPRVVESDKKTPNRID